MGERTLTDADIKAIFAETDRQMAETGRRMAETDKMIKELIASRKDADEKFDLIRKELGGIGENNGLVAEELVYHSLEKSMTFAGVEFDSIEHGVERSRKLADGKRVKGEYDVVLENGSSVAVIEVKYRVGKSVLDKLINEQLPKFRLIFPQYKDFKMYLGLGGMSFEKGVAEEARSMGIATLMLNGEAVEIHDENVKVW